MEMASVLTTYFNIKLSTRVRHWIIELLENLVMLINIKRGELISLSNWTRTFGCRALLITNSSDRTTHQTIINIFQLCNWWKENDTLLLTKEKFLLTNHQSKRRNKRASNKISSVDRKTMMSFHRWCQHVHYRQGQHETEGTRLVAKDIRTLLDATCREEIFY